MDSARRYLTVALCFAVALTALAMLTPRPVHAVSAALVQVINTAANAIPTWRTDNDGRSPVRLYATNIMPDGIDSSTFTLEDAETNYIFMVPPGKRLVVDTVSIIAYPPSGQKVTAVLYNGPTATPIPATAQGTFHGLDTYQNALPLRDYVDPGHYYQGRVSRTSFTGTMQWNVYAVGHLVDCTNGGGCATPLP